MRTTEEKDETETKHEDETEEKDETETKKPDKKKRKIKLDVPDLVRAIKCMYEKLGKALQDQLRQKITQFKGNVKVFSMMSGNEIQE